MSNFDWPNFLANFLGNNLIYCVISFYSSILISCIMDFNSTFTDSLYKRMPMIKLILCIIDFFLWGYLIILIGKREGIYSLPGMLLGHISVMAVKEPKKRISEYHREINIKRKTKMINKELRRIPKRLNKFISKYGYMSDLGFKKTFYESYIFRKARKLNRFEFSTSDEQNTDIFSCFLQQYKIRVKKDLQKHLAFLIPTLQMFGIDDLYELSTAFQDYYRVEEPVMENQYMVVQLANPYEKFEKDAEWVIDEMIRISLIEKIPQQIPYSVLYKSKRPDSIFSSKDAPGAVVEGTTLEI